MESWDVFAPVRQRATLAETGHRPWPLPDGPALMGQTWRRLLFAHWQVPPEQLREHVPRPLELDTLEGTAWLGITPFVLTGLRARAMPPPPLLSIFPELNVRTYVTYGGKPGIMFFSLDAGSRLAVLAARRFYRLPYFYARMSERRSGQEIHYQSRRDDEKGPGAAFEARYAHGGTPAPANAGSLAAFLTERYCLYTVRKSKPFRAEIHHPPWSLEAADAEFELNTMVPPHLELPAQPPLVHFAERQDVLIWPLEHAP